MKKVFLAIGCLLGCCSVYGQLVVQKDGNVLVSATPNVTALSKLTVGTLSESNYFAYFYEGNIDIGINKKGYSPFISYVSLFDLICMQNLDYIGNQHFTAKNYHIGSNIVPTFKSGGVNLKSGSSLDIDVTDTFVIMGDFCCEKGASLNVNISK